MKQGRASVNGSDRKVEPRSTFINEAAVANIGIKQGNHSENRDLPAPQPSLDAGRGYMAPSIGQKRHNSGSQGSY